MKKLLYKSPIGIWQIQIKNNSVYSISKARGGSRRSDFSKADPAQDGLLSRLTEYLNDYFTGKTLKPNNISLCSKGTAFQQKVWGCLRKIPYGQTRTYAQIAKAVGSPVYARAVGAACARNPFLILVPCHRVTAQKGPGGFALGLSAKTFLLRHEEKVLKKRLKPAGKAAIRL